jgi:hypothetical protein
MSLAPKPKQRITTQVVWNRDPGEVFKKKSLILAVYNDKTDEALQIIDVAPEQINSQDPYAGLTPMHIAIFRENIAIVQRIAKHPEFDKTITDNFGRRMVDMLDYTANRKIQSLQSHW